jgi:hypothetical protein
MAGCMVPMPAYSALGAAGDGSLLGALGSRPDAQRLSCASLARACSLLLSSLGMSVVATAAWTLSGRKTASRLVSSCVRSPHPLSSSKMMAWRGSVPGSISSMGTECTRGAGTAASAGGMAAGT